MQVAIEENTSHPDVAEAATLNRRRSDTKELAR